MTWAEHHLDGLVVVINDRPLYSPGFQHKSSVPSPALGGRSARPRRSRESTEAPVRPCFFSSVFSF
jgi:hypothetical protein